MVHFRTNIDLNVTVDINSFQHIRISHTDILPVLSTTNSTLRQFVKIYSGSIYKESINFLLSRVVVKDRRPAQNQIIALSY